MLSLCSVFLFLAFLKSFYSLTTLDKPLLLPLSINELRNEEFSGLVPLGSNFALSRAKIEVIKNTPFFTFSTSRTILIVNPDTNKHYVLNREINSILAYALIQGTDKLIIAGKFFDDTPRGSIRIYDWKRRRRSSIFWNITTDDKLIDIYDFTGGSLTAIHFDKRILFFTNVAQTEEKLREPSFAIEESFHKCKYFEGTSYFICLKGRNTEKSLTVFNYNDGQKKYFFEVDAFIKDFVYIKKADRIVIVASDDALLLVDYRKMNEKEESLVYSNTAYKNHNISLIKEIPSENAFITIGADRRDAVLWSLTDDKIVKRESRRFEKLINNIEPIIYMKELKFVLLSDHTLKYLSRNLSNFQESLSKGSDLHPLQNLFSSPSRIFSLLKVNHSYFLLKRSDSQIYYNKTLNTPFVKVVSVLSNDNLSSTEYMLYLEPDNKTFFFYIITDEYVISEKGVKLPEMVTNFEVSDNYLIVVDIRSDIYSLNWRDFFIENANPMRIISYDKAGFGKPLFMKAFSHNSHSDILIVFQNVIRIYDFKHNNSSSIISPQLRNPNYVFIDEKNMTVYLLTKSQVSRIHKSGSQYKEELYDIKIEFNDATLNQGNLYFSTNAGIHKILVGQSQIQLTKLNTIPSNKLFVKNDSYLISHSEGIQIFDFTSPCPRGYLLSDDTEYCRIKCAEGQNYLFDDYEICTDDCSKIPFYQPDEASVNNTSNQTNKLCKHTCLEEHCEQCLKTGGCMKCKPNYYITFDDSKTPKCSMCSPNNDAILQNGMGECFSLEIAKKQDDRNVSTSVSPWTIGWITLGVAAFIIICIFLIIKCRTKSQTSYENFD